MRASASVLAAVSFLALSAGALGQNLVADGGFASSLEAWHHDANPDGSSAWSAEDSGGSASSGSARLASTAAINGILISLLTQCVPVAAGQSYVLTHKARFADGEAASGWAETVVYWDSGPACTGYIAGNSILTLKAGSGVWTPSSDTFTAPAGAVSAYVQVGIDKIDAGGTLTAWFDDVSFAPAGAPSDTHLGWLPVVGSVTGNFNSLFRTSLTILNPNASVLSGRLVFHAAGQPEAASDPSMGYSLAPGQSFAWADVVGAMGQSGLGSLDVTWSPDVAPPIVTARIFDDAGAAGTSGFTEPMFQGPLQFACCPPPDIVEYLLPPSDLQRYRYNVGVRVLSPPIQMTVEVLDPAGTVVHSLTRTYPEATFEQTTAAEFAGVGLQSGQVLKVTASPFWVLVYGATVDNLTNDPSAQFGTAFSALQP